MAEASIRFVESSLSYGSAIMGEQSAASRGKCVQGALAVIAIVSKTLAAWTETARTGTLIFDIDSTNGILKALMTTKDAVSAQPQGREVAELFDLLIYEIHELAQTGTHRGTTIEVASINGKQTAVRTDRAKFQWY